MGDVLRGDLGQSYFLDRPVTTALLERVEPTLVLTLSALLVAVVIGVPSGIIAAAYQGSLWDRGILPQDTLDILSAERGGDQRAGRPVRRATSGSSRSSGYARAFEPKLPPVSLSGQQLLASPEITASADSA